MSFSKYFPEFSNTLSLLIKNGERLWEVYQEKLDEFGDKIRTLEAQNLGRNVFNDVVNELRRQIVQPIEEEVRRNNTTIISGLNGLRSLAERTIRNEDDVSKKNYSLHLLERVEAMMPLFEWKSNDALPIPLNEVKKYLEFIPNDNPEGMPASFWDTQKKSESAASAQAKAEPKPEPKREVPVKAEPKVAAPALAKAEQVLMDDFAVPSSSLWSKPEPKASAQAQAKAEPKTAAQAQAKAEPKPEPKAVAPVESSFAKANPELRSEQTQDVGKNVSTDIEPSDTYLAKNIGIKKAADLLEVPYSENAYATAEPKTNELEAKAEEALRKLSSMEEAGHFATAEPKLESATFKNKTEAFLNPFLMEKRAKTFKDNLINEIQKQSQKRLAESVRQLGLNLSASNVGRTGYESYMKQKLHEAMQDKLMELDAGLGVNELREQENLAERRARMAQQYDENVNTNLLRQNVINRAEKELERKRKIENIEMLHNRGKSKRSEERNRLDRLAAEQERFTSYPSRKLQEFGENVERFGMPNPPVFNPQRKEFPGHYYTSSLGPSHAAEVVNPYIPQVSPPAPLPEAFRPAEPQPMPPMPQSSPIKDIIGMGASAIGALGQLNKANAEADYYRNMGKK